MFLCYSIHTGRRCRKSKSSNTQNGGAVSQMNLMEMTSPTYNNSLMSNTSPTFQFTLTENTAYASEEYVIRIFVYKAGHGIVLVPV